MSVFRYYISAECAEPAPKSGRLAEVFAENRASAIQKVKHDCRLLSWWPAVWMHLSVWSESGALGFESTRLQ